MKSITFNAILGSIRAKIDRSIGASFTTPELSSMEKAYFFELQNCNVKMTLTPLDEPALEEYKIEKDLDQKPPSVRMRGVLYRLFEQNSEGFPDFNTYYKAKMEAFIEKLKSKLDESY